MSDPSREEMLAEAYKRGLLTPDMKAAYEEAQKRGLFAAPAPKPPSFLDRFKRAIIVPEDERQDKTLGGAIKGGVLGAPEEIATEAIQAGKQILSDVVPTSLADLRHIALDGIPGVPGTAGAFDVANLALTPVTGALTSVVGRPVEEATGLRREITGNALTALIPVGGEGALAAKAEKAAQAARVESSATEYGRSVQKLLDMGVDLTPGQRSGGIVRAQEEAAKSHPLMAQAVHDQEDRAIRSFNNVTINRAISPIGARVAGSGREAIAAAHEKLSQAYERIKPDLKVVPDRGLDLDFADTDKRVKELPEPLQKQFQAIKDNYVLGPLTQGKGMDGEAFKVAESELSNLSREYKGSASPNDRIFAKRIDDLNESLRANMERNSAPGVRDRLKAINKAYAGMVRVDMAAANRAGSLGHFSTGDLLAGVRRADRSPRKKSFAAGEAMMQDFAETAHQVLPNKLPDSGTAYRLRSRDSLISSTLGMFTNPVASRTLERLKPFAGDSKVIRNYLLSNALKTSPFVRRAPAINTLRALTDQSDQQQ